MLKTSMLLLLLLSASSVYVPETRLAFPDNAFASEQKIAFESVKVFESKVVIEEPNLQYAKVISNSMAPLITSSSTVLEKIPKSESEIAVGDIISFYEPSQDAVIMHTVIDKISKNNQVLFKTKGIANKEEDNWLVPFENVKGIVVGILR